VNASRTAVTDIMLSTLKDAREITGTALGVVTDAIRGAFRATGGRRRGGAGCPGPSYPGPWRPWARSAGRYQGRPGGRRAGFGHCRRSLTRRGRSSEEGLMSEASLPGDVIRSVIEGEEKGSSSREAGICGRSSSPGLLSSAFERTA